MVPYLGTQLDNVNLGPGVVAGETQSESPSKNGPVDEVISAIQAQGGEFKREVEPMPPLLYGWGSGVRSRLPRSDTSLYSRWPGRPALCRAN